MKNFHEELAAHVHGHEHPLPHPSTAPSAATRLADRLEREAADTTLDALEASMKRRKADLDAITSRTNWALYEEDRHPPVFSVSLRGVLIALSAGLVLAGIVGLVRGCAS
jgi:hypothetical protein